MNFEQQRIQRLELDLAVANARLIQEREMLHERHHEKLRHAVHRMEELAERVEYQETHIQVLVSTRELVTRELVAAEEARDSARDLVARLWDEIALCPSAPWHTTFQGVPHVAE